MIQQSSDTVGSTIMPQWHGGKGSGRRKGADNDKYRNEYDRIFDQRHSSSTKGNSDTGRT